MNGATHDKARQMAREFKIGITLLAVLFCVFIGVAYRRYRMSFSDTPSKFVAQYAEQDSPDTNSGSDSFSAAGTAHASKPPKVTAPYLRATVEDPRSTQFQLPPPGLPPRDLNAEHTSPDITPKMSETLGGSFQPIAHSPDGVDVVENFVPPSPASIGDLVPAPSEYLPAAPTLPAPATIELAPPTLDEPAAFEQHHDEADTVRRTQFQKREREKTVTNSSAQPAPSPPLTFAIDGPSKPIDGSTRVEPIRAGDSFWLISQRAYGNGGYFRALYEHNRDHFPEPDQLPVGAPVEIPSSDFLRERFPAFCPKLRDNEPNMLDQEARRTDSGRVYIVVGGESLFDVARFQLGQGSRYVEILQLNRDSLTGNREALPAGLKLRLPRQ